MHYRGRLAPSPTGYLHLGHARTFWVAQERAKARSGTLLLRNDDLDEGRCRPEFVTAMLEDLRWLGLAWAEGPDVGGPFGPYDQSARLPLYREAFETLRRAGAIYPCSCSRQDVLRALSAPHLGDDEPIYPGTCRQGQGIAPQDHPSKTPLHWRFRVPDGELLAFEDGAVGRCEQVAGKDFGDFVVWRKDDLPSYQLACIVDDAAMGITEVVRGADLIASTFRQILLARALTLPLPSFFHCPLVTDSQGNRLSKRDGATSLRALRARGRQPESLRAVWQREHLMPASPLPPPE
jgi:glutamyl/glutaminyl-tRNA synthetase